jgi:hypothetical protein
MYRVKDNLNKGASAIDKVMELSWLYNLPACLQKAPFVRQNALKHLLLQQAEIQQPKVCCCISSPPIICKVYPFLDRYASNMPYFDFLDRLSSMACTEGLTGLSLR